MSEPNVSVVVSSDYAAGSDAAWSELRDTLVAIDGQDFDEPFEIVHVESEELASRRPAGTLDGIDRLRLLTVSSESSAEMRNAGVSVARGELVAVLDADCAPTPDWLRHAARRLREDDGLAGVGGSTIYSGRGLVERIFGLLDRAYYDPGRASSDVRFVSHNAQVFRREVLREHPYPTTLSAFEGDLHQAPIRRAGHRLGFEPAMLVHHGFDGWGIERALRRHRGHVFIAARRQDPGLAHAWLARVGWLAIPACFVGQTLRDWRTCLRVGRRYGLRWFELPAAMTVSPFLHLLEIPGMLDALRHRQPRTAYR